ncbi:MAG: protein translocase subunit SecF [Candidatus Pacebacteria bacterium]|nr:protein translocase subunit SecF [Candidatus Paceibacterota bacterium]
MISFIRHRKYYFFFSGLLILVSLGFLITFGLRFGIEFTGGSILEVEYQEYRPSNDIIRGKLAEFDLGGFLIQPTREKGVILRLREIDEDTRKQILYKLGQVEQKRFESIGPVIGRELRKQTQTAIILALLSILFYIIFSFRKISRKIKSWHYGIVSFVALCHDVLIPLGILAILGHFHNIEITIPIMIALLVIFGYSINDTVVVFDRIRENLLKQRGMVFEEVVDISINQTLIRSFNTSFTTLLVLLALFFFGGITLKYFSLVLIIGIIVGTYSSIFLAAPLLVNWLSWKERRQKRA